MHRIRESAVSQRTRVVNQIRAFLLERGIAVRQGMRFLHSELPIILATRDDVLLSRMMRLIEDLRRIGGSSMSVSKISPMRSKD